MKKGLSGCCAEGLWVARVETSWRGGMHRFVGPTARAYDGFQQQGEHCGGTANQGRAQAGRLCVGFEMPMLNRARVCWICESGRENYLLRIPGCGPW